jgi:hypothetical protein
MDAACIYLAAFLVISWLNLWSLQQAESPAGAWAVMLITQTGTLAMMALAFLRAAHSNWQPALFIASLIILAATIYGLLRIARHYCWIRAGAALLDVFRTLRGGVR